MSRVPPLDFKHQPDPGFKSASPFLKHVLSTHINENRIACLDIPCGNGRNIFLLSALYQEVTGVDRQPEYLKAIMEATSLYTKVPAVLKQKDILAENLYNLTDYDLVCNIHFFDCSLLKQLINGMKAGAYLIVETPNCYGGNYQELPTESELTEVIGANSVLEMHFKECGHKANSKGTGSAKFLIKKK